MNFCNRVNHVIKFFNRGFNAPVDGYIFQFVCVAFAGRCRQPISVER